jgi:hypothetical protein
MSYTTNPTGVFGTGITVGASSITIPYSALESYNSSTSGDVREFVYSFLEKVADTVLALPATGRWGKVSVSRGTSVVNDETLRKTYNVAIDLNIQSLDVVDEA